jgi:hypothetical protein
VTWWFHPACLHLKPGPDSPPQVTRRFLDVRPVT